MLFFLGAAYAHLCLSQGVGRAALGTLLYIQGFTALVHPQATLSMRRSSCAPLLLHISIMCAHIDQNIYLLAGLAGLWVPVFGDPIGEVLPISRSKE